MKTNPRTRKTVGSGSDGSRGQSSSSLLPVYLQDVVRSSLIDAEEEQSLARTIRDAKREIVSLALRLDPELLSRVRRWADPELDEPDSWTARDAEDFCDRLARVARFDESVPRAILVRIGRYRSRMQRTREQLTTANLRLVVHLAQRYPSPTLTLMDRIQEGNIGLMRAVDLFDPDRGHRFSTYAVWWIRQAIARAITEKERLIRLPTNQYERRGKIHRVRRALRASLEREPTAVEISEQVDLSPVEVQKILDLVQDPQSLDQMQDERFRDSAIDRIADPHAAKIIGYVGQGEVTDKLARVMREQLTRREERILRLRFGLGPHRTHTLREAGRLVNLSRERTRQIEAAALRKLRDSDVLADLLDNLGGS